MSKLLVNLYQPRTERWGNILSTDQYLKIADSTGNEPVVTLKQASFALLLLLPYIVGAMVLLGVAGALGLVGLTTEALLPVGLAAISVAVLVSLYLHLIRGNRYTFADLGFRRPGRSMIHLLWQIPAAIGAGYGAQYIFITILNLIGLDATSENSIGDIANMSTPMVIAVALSVAVLAPLWEEVLFRGAFLDGFTRRFGLVAGIVLSSALFAAAHMIPVNLVFLFTLGIALALLRRFHGNIWASIALHAVNNGLSVSLLLLTS